VKPPEPPIPPPDSALNSYSVDLGNGIKLEMVAIPTGTFLMGSPPDEINRQSDEGPQTQVDVKAFWMGKYEVTQEQYQAIMGSNPSSLDLKMFAGNPVDTVSWGNAMEFCRRLSQRTKQNYTLPTEAQWEYACRAGSTTRYSFGTDYKQLYQYAWYGRNSTGLSHKVGGKKSNAWGLYDMNGSVWEWCLSLYKPYPYSEADGRNITLDTTGDRVFRGGSSYIIDMVPFRCAYRNYGLNISLRKFDYYGFRCARNP